MVNSQFDLSGAHASIVTRLQNLGPTLLKECMSSKSFWDDPAQLYPSSTASFPIPLDEAQKRTVLKIILYMSFNDGNPLSPARVEATLENIDYELYPELNFNGQIMMEFHSLRNSENVFEWFDRTQIYKSFVEAFCSHPLLAEVKN